MLYAAVGPNDSDIVTAAAAGLEMSADASTGQLCNHGNNYSAFDNSYFRHMYIVCNSVLIL